ncbi:DUF2877 domain-containing protein [Streptomyces sp. SID8379]|uniref:oxamate carbamoyltransferase subunit AllH family protein n=1 Tax=unclassified Streptomyces TaxID=2593676 RepID=UPI00037914D2|nr:DUF2877 domain-containing protein [Streptomyces sp. HmicA12]MYW64970.1 DUF2877 domain-containing protein [Streptomyces sp. SID8379]
MTPGSVVPGAVSTSVARLLTGPPRPARVVAATRYAVHLATGDPGLPALAVVTRDAIRLPNAIVVPYPCAELPLDAARPGTPATLGADGVRAGPYRVRAAGRWTPPRVAPGRPHPPFRGADLERLLAAWAPPAPRPVADGLDRLRTALRAGRPDRIAAAAHALLGLGPGLTPSGDDILCGLLLALPPPLSAPVTAAVADAARRTTLLSAALLRHAVRGECVAPAHALLTGRDLPAALRGLLTVGHHSGGDLARGVAAALALG